jgi:hypothetical protein
VMSLPSSYTLLISRSASPFFLVSCFGAAVSDPGRPRHYDAHVSPGRMLCVDLRLLFVIIASSSCIIVTIIIGYHCRLTYASYLDAGYQCRGAEPDRELSSQYERPRIMEPHVVYGLGAAYVCW